jgi:hypothetical protein
VRAPEGYRRRSLVPLPVAQAVRCDFFVGRGIGCVLHEFAKTAPDAVAPTLGPRLMPVPAQIEAVAPWAVIQPTRSLQCPKWTKSDPGSRWLAWPGRQIARGERVPKGDHIAWNRAAYFGCACCDLGPCGCGQQTAKTGYAEGAVAFEPVAEATTKMGLAMEFVPEGIAEKVAEATNMVERRVEGDLKRFKQYIESHGAETGGWRAKV